MVVAPCCLCNTPEQVSLRTTVDYISGEEFRLVQCPTCSLVYVSPRPEAASLARHYPQTHQKSAPALYERADARPRIKLVSALLGGRTGRVLDVGCGKGLLLAGLRDRGWEVAGTELSEISSRYAVESGIPVHNLSLEMCPLEAASFDVVTFYHSLEHMTHPLQSLRVAHRLLRPGGRLVVEVPNYGSWYARSFGDAWFYLDVLRHLYHFTLATLDRMVTVAGFRISERETHNLQYDAFRIVQSVLNRFLRKKNLLNDFNTGEVTFGKLRSDTGRLRNLGALAISQATLVMGFPLSALVAWMLASKVQGGVLRIVATRA